MSRSNRPLSPHLQIYRWELAMVLSILHRATGVALSAGLLLLVSWLLAIADGADRFAALNGFLGSGVGQVLLVAWTFALFLHLGNGIRHLFWDFGFGFELKRAQASGWAVVAFAIIATVIVWVIGLRGDA